MPVCLSECLQDDAVLKEGGYASLDGCLLLQIRKTAVKDSWHYEWVPRDCRYLSTVLSEADRSDNITSARPLLAIAIAILSATSFGPPKGIQNTPEKVLLLDCTHQAYRIYQLLLKHHIQTTVERTVLEYTHHGMKAGAKVV